MCYNIVQLFTNIIFYFLMNKDISASIFSILQENDEMGCLIYNVLFNKRLRFLEFKYNVSGSHKACLISALLDDAFRSERARRVRAERKERWDAIKQARTRSMKRVSRSNELLDPCYGNLRRHQPTLVH